MKVDELLWKSCDKAFSYGEALSAYRSACRLLKVMRPRDAIDGKLWVHGVYKPPSPG